MADWLVTCSCGWGREASSEWTAGPRPATVAQFSSEVTPAALTTLLTTAEQQMPQFYPRSS